MSKQQHTPGPWEVIGQHVFTKLGATNAHGSKANVWDGWNIATEINIDETAGTTNVTRYVWGLDLSG